VVGEDPPASRVVEAASYVSGFNSRFGKNSKQPALNTQPWTRNRAAGRAERQVPASMLQPHTRGPIPRPDLSTFQERLS
jgi:hypothetical protein